jgi:hypothetical protein
MASGVTSEEDGAGMANPGEQRFGIVGRDLDVFGGKAIGEGGASSSDRRR